MLLALMVGVRAAAAITLADPVHFANPRSFVVSPAVPRPIGGLRFSADGGTLYLIGAADSSSSALYALPVTRHPVTGEVTGLGTPVKVFSGQPPSSDVPVGLDAGLQFSPGTGSLFYTYYPSSEIGERPGGVGGTQTRYTVGGVPSVSGLTFSPTRSDPGTGFGTLQVTTGLTGYVYEVPLSTSATPGLYPVAGFPTLFAKLFTAGPPRQGGQAVTGIEYVPGGAFAGDLLYTSYVNLEVWHVEIDPATGLPVGGSMTPSQDLFASGFTTPPFGLAFDPQQPDSLLLGTTDPDTNGGNVLFEITGFASLFVSTTTSTTTTSSSTTSTSTTSSTTTSSSTTPSSSTTTTSTSSTTTTAPESSTSSTTSTTSTSSATTSTTSSTATTSSSTSTTSVPTTSITSTSTTSLPTTSITSTSTTSVPTTSTTSTSTATTSSTSSSTSSTSQAPTTSTTSSSPTSTSSSSTSSSLPVASTSTTAPVPPTTTTTTTVPSACQPGGPGSCDDGDPCTVDACVAATGCQNVAKSGIDAVLCTCQRPLPATCPALPANVSKLVTRACDAFAQSLAYPLRLRRGGKLLARATRLVIRAGRRGVLPPDCATALAADLKDARNRAFTASRTP